MAVADSQPALDFTQQLVIPISSTTSNVIDIAGTSVQGLIFLGAMTGTTIVFDISTNGTTFYPLVDSTGTEVKYTVPTTPAPPAAMFFPTYNWRCARWLRIISGTHALPTTELAARTLTLMLRQGA